MHVRCPVASLSHTLADDCFRLFTSGAATIRLTRLSAATFAIDLDTAPFEEAGSQHIEYHAHLSASCMLVALNVATAGYFTWLHHPTLHPVYEVFRGPEQPPEAITLLAEHRRDMPLTRELTALDVENAAIVYRMIVNDTSLAARTEYVKGLLHLGASHNDIHFYREAFGNFYRCLENCATKKILQVRKLSNELKQLKKALVSVGADDFLLQAFAEVYAVRSSQVAHAQQDPVDVTFDDVLKVKCLADLMLAKTYRRLAEEMRSAVASAA